MTRRPLLLPWAARLLRKATGGASSAACRAIKTRSRHPRDTAGTTPTANTRAARTIVALVTLKPTLRDPGETAIIDLPGSATLAELDVYARRALFQQLGRTPPQITRIEIELPRARIPPEPTVSAVPTPQQQDGERLCDLARHAEITTDDDFIAAWRSRVLAKPGDPQP